MLKLRSLSVQQIALSWQKVNAIYLYNLTLFYCYKTFNQFFAQFVKTFFFFFLVLERKTYVLLISSAQGSRCSSDVVMLGEMMFGSVAMSYKGSTLKIHQIR